MADIKVTMPYTSEDGQTVDVSFSIPKDKLKIQDGKVVGGDEDYVKQTAQMALEARYPNLAGKGTTSNYKPAVKGYYGDLASKLSTYTPEKGDTGFVEGLKRGVQDINPLTGITSLASRLSSKEGWLKDPKQAQFDYSQNPNPTDEQTGEYWKNADAIPFGRTIARVASGDVGGAVGEALPIIAADRFFRGDKAEKVQNVAKAAVSGGVKGFKQPLTTVPSATAAHLGRAAGFGVGYKIGEWPGAIVGQEVGKIVGPKAVDLGTKTANAVKGAISGAKTALHTEVHPSESPAIPSQILNNKAIAPATIQTPKALPEPGMGGGKIVTPVPESPIPKQPSYAESGLQPVNPDQPNRMTPSGQAGPGSYSAGAQGVIPPFSNPDLYQGSRVLSPEPSPVPLEDVISATETKNAIKPKFPEKTKPVEPSTVQESPKQTQAKPVEVPKQETKPVTPAREILKKAKEVKEVKNPEINEENWHKQQPKEQPKKPEPPAGRPQTAKADSGNPYDKVFEVGNPSTEAEVTKLASRRVGGVDANMLAEELGVSVDHAKKILTGLSSLGKIRRLGDSNRFTTPEVGTKTRPVEPPIAKKSAVEETKTETKPVKSWKEIQDSIRKAELQKREELTPEEAKELEKLNSKGVVSDKKTLGEETVIGKKEIDPTTLETRDIPKGATKEGVEYHRASPEDIQASETERRSLKTDLLSKFREDFDPENPEFKSQSEMFKKTSEPDQWAENPKAVSVGEVMSLASSHNVTGSAMARKLLDLGVPVQPSLKDGPMWGLDKGKTSAKHASTYEQFGKINEKHLINQLKAIDKYPETFSDTKGIMDRIAEADIAEKAGKIKSKMGKK